MLFSSIFSTIAGSFANLVKALSNVALNEDARRIVGGIVPPCNTPLHNAGRQRSITDELNVVDIKLEDHSFRSSVNAEHYRLTDTAKIPSINTFMELDTEDEERSDVVGKRYLTGIATMVQPPSTPLIFANAIETYQVLEAVTIKLESIKSLPSNTAGLVRNGGFVNLVALNTETSIGLGISFAESTNHNLLRGPNSSSSSLLSTPSLHGLSSEDDDSDEEELVISPRRRRL